MKYWIPVSIAVVMAAFVVAGCKETKPPEESWTYVGTWVNPANNGHGISGPPGKVVMTADSMASFDNDTDTTPLGTGSFTLKDSWDSGGDHFFKGISVGSPFNGTAYWLMCVSNNNNTFEADPSTTDYPTSLSGRPDSIFTRQ